MLKTRTAFASKPARQPELLEHLEPAHDAARRVGGVGPHGDAPAVALGLRGHLDLHVRAALDERAEERLVDRRPEVVEVRDPDVLASPRDEVRKEARTTQRVRQVAVPGRVGAGLAVVSQEEPPVLGQAQAEVLRERRDVRRRRPRARAPRGSGLRSPRWS